MNPPEKYDQRPIADLPPFRAEAALGRQMLELAQIDPQRFNNRRWSEPKLIHFFRLGPAGAMNRLRALKIPPHAPSEVELLLQPALRQAPRRQHAVWRDQ